MRDVTMRHCKVVSGRAGRPPGALRLMIIVGRRATG